MTWFKVDDTLHAHKKAMRAGTEAMGLWVLAGSWAADQLTDGWVPQYAISRWSAAADELAGRLVSAGLWVEGEHDGDKGWWFHQWDERQPTRGEVTARRKADAERRAKWREARRNTRASHSDSPSDASPSDSASDAVSDSPRDAGAASPRDPHVHQPDLGIPVPNNGQVPVGSRCDTPRESQQGSALPDPTRPDPVLPTEEPSMTRGRKRSAKPLPDDWQPNAGHAEQARLLGVDLAFQVEQFRNHAEANDRRQVRWDAAFRQWLNNAPRYRRNGSSLPAQPQPAYAGWQAMKTGTDGGRTALYALSGGDQP